MNLEYMWRHMEKLIKSVLLHTVSTTDQMLHTVIKSKLLSKK